MTSVSLDCVLIGHNEPDFAAVAARHKALQEYSGAYRNLKANSVLWRGERTTYMALLNRVVGRGEPGLPPLDVFRLPHLGCYTLWNHLNSRGYAAEVVNNFRHDAQRLDDLLQRRPRCVAITTTFYVDDEPIAEVVEYVRQHCPDTTIVVGGPRIFNICTSLDEETQDFVLSRIGAHLYIYEAQGETTLCALLAQLRDPGSASLSDIPNLLISQPGGSCLRTLRIRESNDLNSAAIDWTRIGRAATGDAVSVRTARSCAFACSFCNFPLMAGRLALSDLATVDQELSTLRELGVKKVLFIDDTFNVPLPRFKALCRLMIERSYGFSWYSMFRCSHADEEAFDLMRRAGCEGVFLGVESGSPTVLAHMNKSVALEKYVQGIAKLRTSGILSYASFIVGFPGESETTVKETADFIEQTQPDFFRAQLYYHDTRVPIHARAAEFGLSGAGYSWRHRSMGWSQACDAIEGLYSSITGSLVFPAYGFDLESVPYLQVNGYTVAEIRGFARILRDALLRSFGESGGLTDNELLQLASLLGRHRAARGSQFGAVSTNTWPLDGIDADPALGGVGVAL